MDSKAYGAAETIKSSDALAEFIRSVHKGQENAMEVIKEVLPDGKERTVIALQNRELQKEAPVHPERMESECRAHVFHDVDTVVKYVKGYGDGKTVILADVGSRRMSVVLNEDSEKGRELLNLQVGTHPLMANWREALSKRLTIPQCAEFLIMNRRQIVGDAKAMILDLSQIRMSTHVELAQGIGRECVNGLMVTTKISGGKDQTTPIDLPDSITIKAPVFIGAQEMEIEIDITVSPGRPGDPPSITMTSSDLATKEIEAFDAMVRQIEAELASSAVVGLGIADYINWNYIKEV